MRRDVFIWDSADLAGAGSVVLRAFAYDSERGVGSDTGVPREVRAGFDTAPSSLGGGATAGVTAAASGDLTGDGRPDLVTANRDADNLTAFFQSAAGAFPTVPDATLEGIPLVAEISEPNAVVLVDIDADGDLDIASANAGSDNVTVAQQVLPGTLLVVPLALAGLSSPSAIIAADLNADGTVDLIVTSPGSDRVAIYYQLVAGLYPPLPSLILGDASTLGPAAVAAADLDGDGDLDIVSANEAGDNLAVFAQTGHGMFSLSPTATLGGAGAVDGPVAVVASDFDLDGRVDIASANRIGNSLTVFLQSAGVFASEPTYTLATSSGPVQPASLAVGDLDGNGRPDLISANSAGNLTVFSLDATTGQPVPGALLIAADGTLSGPTGTFLNDLNGDGLLDVLVANTGADELALLVQDGAGTFSATSPDLTLGSAAETAGVVAVLPSDVDADGDLDLVCASEDDGTIVVYEQLGPATFSSTPKQILGSAESAGARALDIADLDGDARADIVCAARTSGAVPVFFQTEAALFPQAPDIVLGAGSLVEPLWVRAADLDGDGDLDLACADAGADNVAVFFQGPLGVFSSTPDALLGGSGTTDAPVMLSVADLDADGNADIITANRDGNSLAVFRGEALGFPPSPNATLGGSGLSDGPLAVRAADLDRDGDLDLVSANSMGGDLAAFLATGPGVFATAPTVSVSHAGLGAPVSVFLADMDRDDHLDLVAGSRATRNLAIFRQRAPGSFSPPAFLGGPGFTDSPFALVVVDVDGDADEDIVTSQADLDNVAIFFGGH